ncbi:Alpha/Beta hydrolase protein [Aspergillus oleicola]
MTETCAGAIYNRSCFQSDFQSGFEFTSLGTCMPGIQMRISQYKSTYGGERAGHNSAHAQEGDLEVRGDVVFESYFNDPAATQEAFTSDGWFKTGDLASIDDHGNLRLSGRSKELIILNGVNYAPQQVELAIEQANISGVASSSIVCFATRQLGSSTEEVVVIYEHTYDFDDIDTQMEAMGHIARTVMLTIGAHPRILPLPSGRLDKSTLGKVSRAKVRKALQEGKFQDQEEKNNQMIHFFRLAHHIEPRDDTERLIMHVVLDTLNVTEDISIDTCIVAIGITSVDLIRLKVNLQKALDIREISLGTIMTHNTIRSLAAVVKKRSLRVQDGEEYNPLVILQPDGSKTPLWLLHPGIGEVLVFMGLVPYLRDRPIFALRARGFNPGEMPFKNLTEVLATYHHSLKQQQPHGPYAIAGYSYGSMIAFELTKILEANGDSVEFLGSFNLPPHIKDRMRMLDWTAGVLHIAQFCGIISEERSDKLANELRGLSQTEQIARVLSESDPSRCEALALTQESLQTWTNVAWSLQKIGWEYEPSGVVKHMDVFYCQPLKIVSKTREEYRNTKLNQWLHFTRAGVEYHEVDGEHYTMIGPENVARFQRILINAMTARGL